ncbi:MAG: hypothetical protein QOE11_1980 [Solirubrobacteraceae bacterium]|jgi:hypothetical protein|nr:hypothetical protein [Solirubrobacteraceae bacterium]
MSTETDTETDSQAERLTCLYPGCENLAVEGPKAAANGRTGPPPRYCELEEHNASSAFLEMKRLEEEGAGDPA